MHLHCDQSGQADPPSQPYDLYDAAPLPVCLVDVPEADPDDDRGRDRGEDPSSSLDPQETTSHLPQDLYTAFRHSGWAGHRRMVWRVLNDLTAVTPAPPPDLSHQTNTSPPQIHYLPNTHTPQHDYTWNIPPNIAQAAPVLTRFLNAQLTKTRKPRYPWHADNLEAFARCGTQAWVMQTLEVPHRYKLASNRCHLRYCVACQGERGRLITANLREHLQARHVRFATFTVRATDQTLSEALDHLFKSFAKLRRSPSWRNHVRGGLWVLEVTYRPEHDRWHPHLHTLIEGDYFPHDKLRQAWFRATGDSFICDIRPASSHEGISTYLTKYLTKAIAKGVWSHPGRLAECIISLHGRKLLGTFGTWSKLHLLDKPDSPYTWEPYAPASRLLDDARRGDSAAILVATILWKSTFAHWLHPASKTPRGP
jgi:hypothetical protein